MKIKLKPKWHCRKHGGLFLGMRMDFPLHLVGEFDREAQEWESWKTLSFSFGFLFFSVNVDFEYGHGKKA